MSGTRRHFSAEQKAQIVRRHLADKEPVSKLADELQIQPSPIHLWFIVCAHSCWRENMIRTVKRRHPVFLINGDGDGNAFKER